MSISLAFLSAGIMDARDKTVNNYTFTLKDMSQFSPSLSDARILELVLKFGYLKEEKSL
jgi:hypothetical protein